ncbi:hypothetical protein I6A60_39525 [Frankia sp. AgB1.9]|uniref:hypothetical protein n=1 Tax=unclassified Frankia TaxID=2632575 RepID=UPI0019324B5E|nr:MULTISPECIES: hypothetical protein [unclassified Frankia]MBL7553876.1 hypothetical protein [Frankia sp. AgB1.9]
MTETPVAPEPTPPPAHFRVSREELLTIGRMLDLPSEGFADLVAGPVEWPTRSVALAAMHGLMARGLLAETPDGVGVDARLAAMVTIVARPQLVVWLQRTSIELGRLADGQPGPVGTIQLVLWYATPDVAIQVQGHSGAVYELEEIALSALLERVVDHSNLRAIDAVAVGAATGPAARQLPVPMSALWVAGPAADRGDLATAVAALTPSVGADAARPLATALSEGATAYLVATRYRPENGRIEGAVTNWLDAGKAGLWEVPEPPTDPTDPDAVITFVPASGSQLFDSIQEGLPGAA